MPQKIRKKIHSAEKHYQKDFSKNREKRFSVTWFKLSFEAKKKKKRNNKPILRYKRGERGQMLTQWFSTPFGKLEVKILTDEKFMNDNTHFRA